MTDYFVSITLFAVAAVFPICVSQATQIDTQTRYESVSITVEGKYSSYLVFDASEKDLVLDDAAIAISQLVNLSGDRSFFGTLSFNFADSVERPRNPAESDDVDFQVEEAYLGFDFGQHMLGFGRTYYPSDIFDISSSVGLGASTAFEKQGVYGRKVIFGRTGYRYAEILLALDQDPVEAVGDHDYTQDALVMLNAWDIELGVALQRVKDEQSDDHITTRGLNLVYESERLISGIAYSENSEVSVEQFVISYFHSNRRRLSFGADLVDDSQGNHKYRYVNAAYIYDKNLQFHVEVGDNDSENDPGDWLLGLELSF